MNLILLSGGSGKRLWPLSNEIRPKQFLKVLRDAHGNPQSMVQRVYGQIKRAGSFDHIVIATGIQQVSLMREHLGDDVEIVVEPERRDTFPAICLAAIYLALEKRDLLDTPVVVMPVDCYTEDCYFDVLHEIARQVEGDKADLVLMGIKPSYPSERFGYLVPSPNGMVKSFQEKPPLEQAEELIRKDKAFWNAGVFGFRLGYLLQYARNYLSINSYEDARQHYDQLPKTSFDYEVVEHAQKVAYVPYKGMWKDLGTWDILAEELGESLGQVNLAGECKDNCIVNELDIPMLAVGIRNLIVAANMDGILVMDKNYSASLKPYIDLFDL